MDTNRDVIRARKLQHIPWVRAHLAAGVSSCPARAVIRRMRPARLLVALGACVFTASVSLMVLGPGPGVAAGAAPSNNAIAAAINLRAADLPGFKATPSSPSSSSVAPASLTRCAPALAKPAWVSSPLFTQITKTALVKVQSSVLTEPSQAAAENDLATDRKPSVTTCITSALRAVTVPSSTAHPLRLVDVHVADVPFAVTGSAGALDVRIQYAYNAQPGLAFYIDIRIVAAGRDELGLLTLSSPSPFRSAAADRLAALLVSRAAAPPR
jgi:hypothetical protein